MLPRILEFGLQRGEKNRADITDALSIALMEHLNSLERNLGIIGTIAVIAPFVGLFGTVLGIIRAFSDIALKGNSTPAVVAAGVSEALVTTATGLIIAVIAVVFFNYFKTRIKSYNQEMIVAANQMAEMLHFHNTGSPIPTDLYQPVK
jgi:biopolymer transport protein ExbB